MRVALLSDDWKQTLVLRHCLVASGHTMSYCKTLADLATTLESDSFDAVIASYDAPDHRGLEIVAQIRWQLRSNVPVILLTPHRSEEYVVRALREGADDYMSSPVRQREFLARVEAVTRRTWHSPTQHRPLQAGRLEVNLGTRRILLDGVSVNLTTKDFDLAVLLLRNVGRLISRTRILQTVWGRKWAARSRTLDTHISRLRTKLELNESNGWKLSALYRRGYRLERVAVKGEAVAVPGSGNSSAKES